MFIDAEGAHAAPFVMISAQPHLPKIFKFAVLRDLSGIQMAVIVNDREMLGIPVIEGATCLGGEIELLVKFPLARRRPPGCSSR